MVPSNSAQDTSMIDTPCVKICTLDVRLGLCLGCGRTIDEITRWATMSVSERTQVMREFALSSLSSQRCQNGYSNEMMP